SGGDLARARPAPSGNRCRQGPGTSGNLEANGPARHPGVGEGDPPANHHRRPAPPHRRGPGRAERPRQRVAAASRRPAGKNEDAELKALTADVGAQRIAHTYAEALLNAAGKHDRANEVVEELDSLVSDLFAAEPQFEAFLAATAVNREQKEATLRK